jgi:hypothetical protein
VPNSQVLKLAEKLVADPEVRRDLGRSDPKSY